jgi:16S rRNA processing protein RimM
LRPHALRGEVRVQAFSASARNLQKGRIVFLLGEPRAIERARPDREHWILKLKGLGSRNEVEGVRGELLEAPDADVQRDDDESFFIHELVGMRVVTSAGKELGRISEVLQSGAADVYVVKGETGEVLIPAIASVIERIDVKRGEVSITPLPGMLDESK